MKLLMFSVYDSKAEAFLQPFFSGTRGQAVRSFSDAVNDGDHQFHRHAEDYTLFVVGEFDQVAGMLSAMAPETLGNAVQYRVNGDVA